MQSAAQVTKESQKRHEQVFRTGNLSQHERIRRTFNHKVFTEKRCTRSTSKPYEYMTDASKYDERELPPIEAFYSKLADKNISEGDYERAKDVWREFGIENMHQYHDLYLKTDVLLLADVFENFRKVSMTNYG